MANEYVNQAYTLEDLRLIQAMCRTACPYQEVEEMFPAFREVYLTTTNLIRNMEQAAKAMPYSDEDMEHDEYECMHYDDGCRCLCLPCRAGKGVETSP